MKRNFTHENRDDSSLVNNLLDDLMGRDHSDTRLIPIKRRGDWIPEQQHVKVKSTKGLDVNLVKHSKSLGYFYLDRLEAVHCLESNRLIVFHNGLPVSVAEAYHILIPSLSLLHQYIVFRHLNKNGYVCIKPKNLSQIYTNSELNFRQSQDSKTKISEKHLSPCITLPRDIIASSEAEQQQRQWQEQDLENLRVFDVYKRETFVKCKLGEPNFRLIALDNSMRDIVNIKECLTAVNKFVPKEEAKQGVDSGNIKPEPSSVIPKIIFALLDDDLSLNFVEFKLLEITL